MKCRVCGKEIEDGSEFCRYCGASQQKKRKPTWSERKRERERETAEIIKKASLTEQDVLLAVPTGTNGLEMREIGETRKTYIRTAVLAAVYSLITAAALAGLVLMIRLKIESLSGTVRAVICFALLLALAGFGATAAEKIYSAGVFKKMSRSVRAIKKVSYGRAPYVTNDGKIYQLVCNAKCTACGAGLHIEEFDGKLYEVCDYDRTHLYALPIADIYKNLLGVDILGEDGGAKEEETAAYGCKDGDADKKADADKTQENPRDVETEVQTSENVCKEDGDGKENE